MDIKGNNMSNEKREEKLDEYYELSKKIDGLLMCEQKIVLEVLEFMKGLNETVEINFYARKSSGESKKQLKKHHFYKTDEDVIRRLKDINKKTKELRASNIEKSCFWTENFLEYMEDNYDERLIMWAFKKLVHVGESNTSTDKVHIYETFCFYNKSGKIVSTAGFGG